MNKKEIIDDYVKRWGNAQQCESCKHVMAYGPYSKVQICCGKPMQLIK